MPECVLTSREKGWSHWAKQFAAVKGRQRHVVTFRSKSSTAQILQSYRAAAKQAKGGTLIVSAGHGGGSRTQAMVDLAPAAALRVTLAHLRIHVQGRPFSRKSDQLLMQTVKRIGAIVKTQGVKSVLFISCNVGNSLEFLGAIADQWNGCRIGGYRKDVEIAWEEFKPGRRTYYVFLKGKEPTTDDGKKDRATNYPPLKGNDYWSASRGVKALPKREASVPPVFQHRPDRRP